MDDSDKDGKAIFKMGSKNDVRVHVNSIHVFSDDD
jgi:hypothetical protein